MKLDLSQMNPRQVEFFRAKARHVSYGGARGGGKSWAMRMKFVTLAIQYPGLKLLLLRRTLPELRENHLLPLLALLTGFARYKSEERAFLFPNGSRLKLGYCDIEKDVFQYQGQEYDVVGFEEATLFTESQIQFVLTCNRSIRPDFKPRAFYTMNPGGVSHAYFKRLFIDRRFRENENPDDYLFIPARVQDNPVLIESNPEYVQILKALPEPLRRAHLDGDWDVFLGQVFNEFSRETHVLKPFAIPKTWTRFRSMDWGFAKPYAVLWYAVDFDGVIYVYRELYGYGGVDVGTKETATEVARRVRALEQGEEVIGFADPAIWSRTGHDGPTIAEEFAIQGVGWQKADNDRIQGKMQVHLRLKEGKLKFFETCQHLIRTLPAMVYDQHRPEDVDTRQEDHAYDSLRYGLMSRPWVPEQTKKRPYDEWEEDEAHKTWMGS